jgi:hypothetical protein
MKCYTYNNDEITEGIDSKWNNCINEASITNASIRFYATEQNGMEIAEAARNRKKDMFLYGYVELIPETEPGTLFPEGSYLLDIKTSEYIPDDSDMCMLVDSNCDRLLLGCLPEATICTDTGCIQMVDGELTFNLAMLTNKEVKTFDNVIVLEA